MEKTEKDNMDTNSEAYGKGAVSWASIPQCETCEYNKTGNPLLCRCYDIELKLMESGDNQKPEAKAEFGDKAEAEAKAGSGDNQKPEEKVEPGDKAEAGGKAESGDKAEAGAKRKTKSKPAAKTKAGKEEKAGKPGKAAKRGKKAAVFFSRHSKGVCCGALAVMAMAGGAVYWFECQPRFHDLTVELGTETINIEAFMTGFADVRNAGIVTDPSEIDISGVGSTLLTLRSGHKDETVTLTIVDTTPPEAEFISRLEKTPDYVPDPYDFVASYYDLSEVAVRFAEAVAIPQNYEDQSFTVVVEDACGNSVSQACTLSIVWLKSEYTMELGETLSKEDLLFCPDLDSGRIEQADIDAVNGSGAGEYTIVSNADESVCRVLVADTTPPELVLTDISIFQGEKVTVESFVTSCFDISGDVEVRLVTEPDVNSLGKQTMTVEAKDVYGNVATAEAVLAVVKDKTPPVIKGLTTLSVEKRSEPNYLKGVSAKDAVDGACEVTYDASGVNLTAAGTYYVTYTSQDKEGNVARVKRTVVVEHDQEDTDALADSIAAGLSSDAEEIRDWVRDTIKYSHNSGGTDPTWYGFTNKSGDCLVHASCLQSLLVRKGYETQMIWVTDRSHYWLIVKLDGVWKHIDATPGTRHSHYSLMTDAERYASLQGRDWDRSAWPACE